jgi:hypothetical protein
VKKVILATIALCSSLYATDEAISSSSSAWSWEKSNNSELEEMIKESSLINSEKQLKSGYSLCVTTPTVKRSSFLTDDTKEVIRSGYSTGNNITVNIKQDAVVTIYLDLNGDPKERYEQYLQIKDKTEYEKVLFIKGTHSFKHKGYYVIRFTPTSNNLCGL